MRRRLARSPFLWLVILLAALELSWSRTIPYRHMPQAGEVARQPLQHRGWPEYLRGPDGPETDRLVVLISNSQGTGSELRDAEQIYAARLRRRLGRHGSGIALENWSKFGLGLLEADLMSIRAVTREADLVVYALSQTNLSPVRQGDIDRLAADISLLLGSPSSWPWLPGSLVATASDLDDVAATTLKLGSSLVRSRDAVLDRIADRVEWHHDLLGHRRMPGRGLDVASDPRSPLFRSPRRALPREPPEPRQPRLPDDVRFAEESLRSWVRILVERHAAAGARLVWVWVPANLPAFREGPEELDALRRGLNRVLTEAGIEWHDLTDALPPERFIRGRRSHLDAAGHLRLADLMLPIIRQAIGRDDDLQ